MKEERRYKVYNVEHYRKDMENTEKLAIKHDIYTGLSFITTVVDTLFLGQYKDILRLLLLFGVGAGTSGISVLLNLKEMVINIARLINFNKIEFINVTNTVINDNSRVTNNVTTSENEVKYENVPNSSFLNEEDINSDTRYQRKINSETNFQDERPKVSLAKKPLIKGVSLKKK